MYIDIDMHQKSKQSYSENIIIDDINTLGLEIAALTETPHQHIDSQTNGHIFFRQNDQIDFL